MHHILKKDFMTAQFLIIEKRCLIFPLSVVKSTKIVYLCFLFQPSLPIYVSIKGIVFDVSDSRGKIIFLKSRSVIYNF